MIGGPATVATPLAALTLVGHGWGPGVGMGQWGDFGYAVRYHFGYERILNHFYGGTAPATLAALHEAADPVISVVLLENLDLATNVGYDPVVTSTAEFTVTGQALAPGPPAVTLSGGAGAASSTTVGRPSGTTGSTSSTTTSTPSQPTSTATPSTSTTAAPAPSTSLGTSSSSATTSFPTTTAPASPGGTTSPPAAVNTRRYVIRPGRAVDLRLAADGTWSVYVAGSCAAARAAARTGRPMATGLVDPVVTPASTQPDAPLGKLLTVCRHDGVDERLRGRVEAYDREGYERTLNLVRLEDYVAGVVPGEVSASWGLDGAVAGAPQQEPWGFQALEAQAVAARSYVLARAASGGWNGYADTCDSIYCQNYVGAAYETPVSDQAVQDTAGEVRVSGSGAIVSTTYSASTGGYSAPEDFPAVPDLGDACVVPGTPLECNPVHTWSVTVSGAALDRAFTRAGDVVSVSVTSRNRRGSFGGRVLDVIVSGERRRVVVSGDAFAAALGLRSNWFALAAERRVGAPTTTSGPTTTVPTSAPTTSLLPATTAVTTTTTVTTTTAPTTTSAASTTTAAASG